MNTIISVGQITFVVFAIDRTIRKTDARTAISANASDKFCLNTTIEGSMIQVDGRVTSGPLSFTFDDESGLALNICMF